MCTHALCKCQSVYPGSFYSLCPNNSRASRTPLPVIRIRLSDVHGLHTRVPRPRCCQITSLRPKTAGRASPSAKASPLTSISALRQSRERLFQETSGALTRVTCHPTSPALTSGTQAFHPPGLSGMTKSVSCYWQRRCPNHATSPAQNWALPSLGARYVRERDLTRCDSSCWPPQRTVTEAQQPFRVLPQASPSPTCTSTYTPVKWAAFLGSFFSAGGLG